MSPTTRRAVVLRRLAAVAPDALLAGLMALCVAVTVAIALRMFTPWLVLALLAVLLVPLARLLPTPPALDRGHVAGAIASIVGAGIWAGVNFPYAAQLLWVTRDPGIYTVLGVWLEHHSEIRPLQGGPTLPGLLGVGGWIAGTDGVLRANLVVGAVALVGVYAVARRFVRPWLALSAEAALALSVPFLHFMRAPFSEGITLAATMAAVIWAAAAFRERRLGLALVGGAFVGVASAARIDGPLAVVAAGALVSVVVVVVADADYRPLRTIGAAYVGAAVVTGLLGLAVLLAVVPGYVQDLRRQVISLWAGVAVVLAVAVLVVVARAVLGRRSPGWQLSDRVLRVLGTGAGLAVPLLFVLWWSRPLWWQAHFIPRDSYYVQVIEGWQRESGQPVDGTRSYDELTLHWVGWYFGWATVVLAALGLGLMVRRGLLRRDPGYLALIVPTAVAASLYMNRIDIAPDQLWAYRRLLPIITPGVVIGAVVAVQWWLGRRVPRIPRYTVGALAVILIVLGPLPAWSSLLSVPDGAGNQRIVSALCAQLRTDPVHVATGQAPGNIALTIQLVCGRRATTGPATQAAELDALEDGTTVVAFGAGDLPPGTVLGPPNVSGTQRFWRGTLVRPPEDETQVAWQIWIGHVQDGRFVQDAAG